MNRWYAKDVQDAHEKIIKDSDNPEVVAQVLAEIKKGDELHKKNYTEMRKDFEEFKHLMQEEKVDVDPLIKNHISKLQDSITVRQDEMDAANDERNKKMVKRIDELETAFRRPAGVNSDMHPQEMEKMAMQFKINCLSLTEEGAKWNIVKNLKPDMAEYKAYNDAFVTFIRQKGDERSLGPDAFKSLSVGSDPDGGYTVTPAMGSRIVSRVREMDPIRQLAANESITTGAIEWMVDWGQAGFGWEGETETGDETNTPEFKKKRIPVHVMYAKPRATQTLLEDSGINIENWLADHVANRFARAEGAAFVTGDAIGKPRGFLTYDNVDTAGTPQWGRIERINMGAAAALTADGFNDIKYSLVEFYLNRGTWLMNRLTVSEAMKLKDGNGQYIWQPGLQAGQPATLSGLPLRMSTTMPTVAAGSLSVALADWSEAYMIVDRLGVTVQRDPYTVKPFVEFYTRKRVGADVINFEAIRIGVVAA